MLKNILKLKGALQLSNKEQKNIQGGQSKIPDCNSAGDVCTSPNDCKVSYPHLLACPNSYNCFVLVGQTTGKCTPIWQ